MEATRRQITSFAQIEKVIDQLCAVAHPRNRETYRRALEDLAIVCARFGADELRAKIAAESTAPVSDLATPFSVH